MVFPWEREIVFQGFVALDVARRLDDGYEWTANGTDVSTGMARRQ
jgi:hypothetical protein